MRQRKRFLAGLLSVGLMMACVLSVNAATATVQHTHSYYFEDKPIQSRILARPGDHTTVYFKVDYCSCGEKAESILSSVTELHNIEYSDAGHMSGGMHKYLAHCNYCGYSTTIVIDCPGGHATP